MSLSSKIYVAGHRGLVGTAICRELQAQRYQNIVGRTSKELDLCDQAQVRRFFDQERPQYVFLSAAKVGGILANDTYRADFVYNNLMIQSNIIKAAADYGVKRLLFLGSTCIYPRDCPQPMEEKFLLTGPLETTNRPYAVAKIAGIELCWSFNRQYSTKYIAAMPTNLYGPGDSYDLETSHVIPAIMRKMHEAKVSGGHEVALWGTGAPRREFLYSEDLAQAAVFLLNLAEPVYTSLLDEHEPPLINVGFGRDITIAELAPLIANTVGFKGNIVWNDAISDGTPQKMTNVNKIHSLGWKARTSLKEGLKLTYEAFRASQLATIT